MAAVADPEPSMDAPPYYPAAGEGLVAPAVRCSLCGLPVARSRSHPPVLLHQALARHGSSPQSAVDFFLADPCPQEGVGIPAEFLGVVPPAPLDPFGWD